MGFKEDYEAYKQRKEVQKYFRSQNDLYLDKNEWIKVIIVSALVSVVCGLSLGFITEILSWNIMYLYILLGYIIARTVKSVSGIESEQMGILSGVLTFIACVIAQMPFAYLSIFNIPFAFLFAIESIISDLFVLLFVVVGVFVAYTNAK